MGMARREDPDIGNIVDICQWMADDGWGYMKKVGEAAITADAVRDTKELEKLLKQYSTCRSGPKKQYASYMREIKKSVDGFRETIRKEQKPREKTGQPAAREKHGTGAPAKKQGPAAGKNQERHQRYRQWKRKTK